MTGRLTRRFVTLTTGVPPELSFSYFYCCCLTPLLMCCWLQAQALLEWMNGVLKGVPGVRADYSSLEELHDAVGTADLCSVLAEGRSVGNIWRDSTSRLCHIENATLVVRFAQTVLRIKNKPPFIPNGLFFVPSFCVCTHVHFRVFVWLGASQTLSTAKRRSSSSSWSSSRHTTTSTTSRKRHLSCLSLLLRLLSKHLW